MIYILSQDREHFIHDPDIVLDETMSTKNAKEWNTLQQELYSMLDDRYNIFTRKNRNKRMSRIIDIQEEIRNRPLAYYVYEETSYTVLAEYSTKALRDDVLADLGISIASGSKLFIFDEEEDVMNNSLRLM